MAGTDGYEDSPGESLKGVNWRRRARASTPILKLWKTSAPMTPSAPVVRLRPATSMRHSSKVRSPKDTVRARATRDSAAAGIAEAGQAGSDDGFQSEVPGGTGIQEDAAGSGVEEEAEGLACVDAGGDQDAVLRGTDGTESGERQTVGDVRAGEAGGEAAFEPLVNLALGDGASGSIGLIEVRQAGDVLEEDGFGRGVDDEVGVGEDDVGVAVVEGEGFGEEVAGAGCAEVGLFDAAQSIPGAGVFGVQGDGGLVGAGGFGEVGAAVVDVAREAEEGIVVIGGESVA